MSYWEDWQYSLIKLSELVAPWRKTIRKDLSLDAIFEKHPKMFLTHRVHPPPFLLGGVWNSNQILEKGGGAWQDLNF